MAHPTWLAYGFAVVMVAVSLYCIGRLLAARRLGRSNHTAVNISHVLMGIAMVGMLVPRWNVLPNGLWEIVFGIIVAYFLGLSIRFVMRHGLRGHLESDQAHHISHYLIHMFMGCTMLYMYWLGMPITAPSEPGMSMTGPPSGSGDPLLTLGIITVLFASAIWQTDSVGRFSPRQLALGSVGVPTSGDHIVTEGDSGPAPWLAPRLEMLCHIAMCLTMGYMLVLMV